MEKIQNIATKFNIKMEKVGTALELTNKIRLGRSEADLVQDMHDCLHEMNEEIN